MPDFISSLIRTVVPFVVSFLITTVGLEVNADQTAAFLTMFLGAVYYAVVRFLEDKVGGKFGWLLGLAKPPTY